MRDALRKKRKQREQTLRFQTSNFPFQLSNYGPYAYVYWRDDLSSGRVVTHGDVQVVDQYVVVDVRLHRTALVTTSVQTAEVVFVVGTVI